MRITGPNGPSAPAGGSAARRPSGSTFSLSEPETTSAPTTTGGVRTLAGIEALMALQGVAGAESVDERRRRAVKRGHTALDVLDEMKISLLAGRLEPSTLLRLKAAAADLKDHLSGDPQVDQVLAEIDLRVEVELAKVESANGP